MRTARTRAATALAIVGVLVLGACSEDEAAQERTARRNLAGAVADAKVAGTALTDDQASCLAEAMVSGVGVDRLRDYGLLDAELRVDKGLPDTRFTERDADAVAAGFVRCVDAVTLIRRQFVDSASGLPADVRRCVAESVTDETARTVVSLVLRKQSDRIGEALAPAFAECRRP